MFCPKSRTFFPEGVVISLGLNCSCSRTGTLSEAVGTTLCFVSFALPP